MTLENARPWLALAFLFAFAPAAHAEIYKWVDKDGNVHFGDRAPAGQNAEKRDSSEPPPPDSPAPDAQGTEGTAEGAPQAKPKGPLPKNATVVMYTTSWCGYCKKARAFFNTNGILFTDYDIEKDPAAMERRLTMGGGKGVPLVIINGSVIRGYSPSSFEEALRRQ